MAYTAKVKFQIDYFRFKSFYSVLHRKYTTLENFVKQNFQLFFVTRSKRLWASEKKVALFWK